jgi:hypothetical protein
VNKQFTFPWWFKIIAYALSLAIVGVSMFFIIIKGILFGDEKVGKWLTSFLVSVLASAFVTQPLQVILLSLFFVFLCRKANDANDLEYDHNDNGESFNKIKFDYEEKIVRKTRQKLFFV